LAKIAVTDERVAIPPQAHALAQGDGWSVSEMVCTLGPQDFPFEERHAGVSIAIVIAGTFQYRSHAGCELMTPGSLLLGSMGQNFECSHEHGTGDRCLSFSYSPEFFYRLDARPRFRALRVPRIPALSPLIARASAALAGAAGTSWEELGIELAARTAQLDRGLWQESIGASPGANARVTRVLRAIECDPDRHYDLSALARESRLSPYHFLRTFQCVTGVTPHQYLLRMRLQRVAVRLRTESRKVVDIALECGFGDISNFNRTFRAEFGVSPCIWRRHGKPGSTHRAS
jgi:AraC-like DNA-binding protein